jgi:hypothetical protein
MNDNTASIEHVVGLCSIMVRLYEPDPVSGDDPPEPRSPLEMERHALARILAHPWRQMDDEQRQAVRAQFAGRDDDWVVAFGSGIADVLERTKQERDWSEDLDGRYSGQPATLDQLLALRENTTDPDPDRLAHIAALIEDLERAA